jgi:hypothetical protein
VDDAEWDEALKRALDHLERLRLHADTPARSRACVAYREVLVDWHRGHYAALLTAVAGLETTARRWRAERALPKATVRGVPGGNRGV